MSRHEDQNAAVRDQFGKQADAYARLVRSRTDPSFTRFVEALHVTSVDDVLRKLAFWQTATAMPLEAVLATSFPDPGNLERVRGLYREDAVSGQDRLGMNAREENGQILVTYPMTTLDGGARTASRFGRACGPCIGSQWHGFRQE
jgi:hypothetical protein